MTIPRPLVECIVGSIVLLEYSSDSEVQPDVADRGLEDIVSSLAALNLAEQRDFLALCAEVAERYQGRARAEVPRLVAESLGLDSPGEASE